MNSRSRKRPPAENEPSNQGLARRTPRQQRSLEKIELMFEAAMRLLEEGDLADLTTNAIAERAGVSIGTLYQYFDDKQVLLEALTRRELGAMREKVTQAVQDSAVPMRQGDRIRRLVRIVTGAYGGRGRAHRQLIEHALARGTSRGLSPLYAQITRIFTSHSVTTVGGEPRKLTPAQAFVVTHATAGTLRALAAHENPPPIAEIEDALAQMVYGYIVSAEAAPAGHHARRPKKP